MRQAWAVTDGEDLWALFATQQAADDYRRQYLESETAGWDQAERPGYPDAITIVVVSLFEEAAEVPDGYAPEWA